MPEDLCKINIQNYSQLLLWNYNQFVNYQCSITIINITGNYCFKITELKTPVTKAITNSNYLVNS
jgi:hypothetical protein